MNFLESRKIIILFSSITFALLLFNSCETTEPLFDKYSPEGTYTISWNDLPKISDDNSIKLGGFSGLYYSGDRVFYTITNRGPVLQNMTDNGATSNYLDINFSPRLVKIELQDDHKFKVIGQVEIKNPLNQSCTGKIPSTSWENELFTNSENINDDWGVFPSGVLLDINNHFIWFSDQYQPGLFKMTVDGQWLRRLRPTEGIRRAFGNHSVNGGLTGIDFTSDGRIVTVMGKCLDENRNPEDITSEINYALRRIAIVNFENNSDLSMFYFVENEEYDGIPSQHITLGDIAAVNDTSYLVTEYGHYNGITRNLLFMVTTSDSTTKAVVGLEGIEGKTFETLDESEWRFNNLNEMKKILIMDLSSYNVHNPDGLTILNSDQIAIINNNHFGIESGDANTGKYNIDKSPIYLEVISLPIKLDLK